MLPARMLGPQALVGSEQQGRPAIRDVVHVRRADWPRRTVGAPRDGRGRGDPRRVAGAWPYGCRLGVALVPPHAARSRAAATATTAAELVGRASYHATS